MMPSYAKFKTWHNEHPNVSDEVLERLHSSVFQSVRGSVLRASQLVDKNSIPTIEVAERLLHSLALSGLIDAFPIECPFCAEKIPAQHWVFPLMECPHCHNGINVRQLALFSVEASGSRRDRAELNQFAQVRNDIELISAAWLRQGFLYYCLIDLAGSEVFQNIDNGHAIYRDFQRDYRRLWKRSLRPELWQPSLILGEVGDLTKFVCSNVRDVIRLVRRLSEDIREDATMTDYAKLLGKSNFPQYKVILGLLDEKTSEPYKQFEITLDGSVDLNSPEITSIYRGESELKALKAKYYSQDFDVAFWVFNHAADGIDDLIGADLGNPGILGKYGRGYLFLLNRGEIKPYSLD